MSTMRQDTVAQLRRLRAETEAAAMRARKVGLVATASLLEQQVRELDIELQHAEPVTT